MMRAAPLLLLLSAGLVAGCRGDAANSQNGQGIRIANEHHDNLMKLSPGYQRITLRRAVHDQGYRRWCRDVTNVGYQEEYQNMRMWVAECAEENRTFAVFIAPNGDVQVRNCDDAGTLSLPRCQGLPPPVEDPSMPKVQNGAADEAYRQRPSVPDAPAP